MLTLFYYFHFIVLICVRLRYLRARSLSLAPPTAARPMAAGRAAAARARAAPRRVAPHAPRTDTATILIVSNYSLILFVPRLHLPLRDNFNVAVYIPILTEIPLCACFIVGGASRQRYSISNKPFASEKLF